MSLQIQVHQNGDHSAIAWFPSDGKRLAHCLGYAIEQHRNGQMSYLHSFVGFADTDKLPAQTWQWPLQRFMWSDYTVKPGDQVQYRVVPVVGPDHLHLTLAPALASALSAPLTITGKFTPHLGAYFNRGIVATQWVSRELDAIAGTGPRKPKMQDVIAQVGNPLRDGLGGQLKVELLKALDDLATSGGTVFAALYELNDPELLAAFEKLGTRANIILANGAFGPDKPDESKAARDRLRAGGKVNVFDRMVSSGHFAHNKFSVFCDANGKAFKVATGSVNYTMTGLCTQANNMLVIEDAAVAENFRAEWDRLHAAGNGFPDALIAANSTLRQFTVDNIKVTPWFAPTRHAEDLDYARTLINRAKEGILFLFFNPGAFQAEPAQWTLLQSVLNRHAAGNNPFYDGSLYLRGVVNQSIPKLTDEFAGSGSHALDPAAPTQPVALYADGKTPPLRLGHEVLVPAAIKDRYGAWEDELLSMGVMIHSKVIVLDPFGANPVVMTGSHNLGFKASSKNDDNLVILEGARDLAIAYAANIIAIYQSYRFNHYVEEHRNDPKRWHGLVDVDTWQDGYLEGDQAAEQAFWMR